MTEVVMADKKYTESGHIEKKRRDKVNYSSLHF